MITRLAIESKGKYLWFPLQIHRKINVKSGGKNDMSRNFTANFKHEYHKRVIFLPVIDVISRQCQITAHCIHNCIEVQLSELSCLSAVSASVFFSFFLFLVEIFWSRKQKCVGVPPPPPPLGFAARFLGGPLCLFLDGLGALLLGQSALPSLKCPFCKWPCPSKSLIRALYMYIHVVPKPPKTTFQLTP